MLKELVWMTLGAGTACIAISYTMIVQERRKPEELEEMPLGVETGLPDSALVAANDGDLLLKHDWRDKPIAPGLGKR